jgi:hypothetical protein
VRSLRCDEIAQKPRRIAQIAQRFFALCAICAFFALHG